MQCVLKASLLLVGEGSVESNGVKEKRLGVFMEVLRDKQRFV